MKNKYFPASYKNFDSEKISFNGKGIRIVSNNTFIDVLKIIIKISALYIIT